MKHIHFISDQFFPRTSADSEQIISSLSSLSKLTKVTLVSASYLYRKPAKREELEHYYGRDCSFELAYVTHLFKNVRGIEKISFAISAALKIKKSNSEIAFTRNIPVVIAIFLLTKKDILFESYRPWPDRNILSQWFFKRLSNKDRILGVILHSEFAKKSFQEVGFNDDKLLVAHNAFESGVYDETDSLQIRKEFGLPEDKVITTYSGRVTEKKGLLKLVQLAKAFPNHFFLIIGSEKYGDIEKQAKKFDNIKVLGWLDRKTVFALLKASDILYLPPTLMARDVSKNTVLPIKTFIYKASGTAIFGPGIADVQEVLTHKENAYLVEPDNWNAQELGFKELSEDQFLRNTLGKKASLEMKTNTWDNRASEIFNFISNRINAIKES